MRPDSSLAMPAAVVESWPTATASYSCPEVDQKAESHHRVELKVSIWRGTFFGGYCC